MSATARRLDRLDTVLPLAPELEALCDRIAAAAGVPVAELREEALRIGRAYAGRDTETMIAGVAAELDLEPAQLRADADAIATEAGICLG